MLALPRLADKRLGPMIFWSIAIAVTAIACAALFYAGAGRTVNAAGPEMADPNDHFRRLLSGIEADEQSGKLDADQAVAARGELARELLRSKGESRGEARDLGRSHLLVGLVTVAVLSLGLYGLLGRPDLPAQPLAERPEVVAGNLDMNDAIARIEARLAETPDDVRGWQVIAPAYVELGRFADAAEAYRRVIALSGPTADLQTDLAEALLLGAGGDGSDEAMAQLRAAAEADASHVRSRLYLAAELMRTGQYDEAATYWQQAIDFAQGDEPWLPAATQGLAVAQAGGVDTSAQQQAEMIAGMVGGLSERLYADGGSVEEWTQLVRSYLVLNDRENAQRAFDAAVAAYPAAFDRGELDTLALDAGLTLNGGNP
jgi:cytochrome c-type biogenesis protein CcmH